MTIGDVLAALAAVFALGATWTAALLLAALVFPVRAERAQRAITETPWACLARGAAALLVLGLAGAFLVSRPAAPLHLIGFLIWAALLFPTAVGGAGVVRLVGGRIEKLGTPMSPFAALTRGTILYVVAGFLPVVGWFLLAPAALLFSLGAGMAGTDKASGAERTERRDQARQEEAGLAPEVWTPPGGTGGSRPSFPPVSSAQPREEAVL